MSQTVLISSAGRRVGLLKCFLESLHGKGRVLTVDHAGTNPAAHFAGDSWIVPSCTSPGFIDCVLELCVREGVNLVIPTIDPELPVYAAAAQRFEAAGVTVCISGSEAVKIGGDKIATNLWLNQNGFPAVRQGIAGEVIRSRGSWTLPLIAKPRAGSASLGVRSIEYWDELESFAATEPGYVIEEKATGREFTINAYVARDGLCVCVVPHWRLEVRAGEVSKGVTSKDPRLVSLGKRIAEALPRAWGPLNIQCFLDSSGNIRVFEINTRFGGGYPLAHNAGATFTSWILHELAGRTLSWFDGWEDNLAMFRYDEAVFIPYIPRVPDAPVRISPHA
jgi:carbamoyl-phosphate synthase large subunit